MMLLLSKLELSNDLDSSCRLALQITEFFDNHSGDYRLSQQITTDQNLDSVFEKLQQIIPEK